MRWPWSRRRPADTEAIARGRDLDARIDLDEARSHWVIAHAELSKRRAEAAIRENHLAPAIAAALRSRRPLT